jgi:predicted component of type VI protein secretion system
MSKEKNYNAGREAVIREIERYIEQNKFEPRITRPIENMLAQLKKNHASDR